MHRVIQKHMQTGSENAFSTHIDVLRGLLKDLILYMVTCIGLQEQAPDVCAYRRYGSNGTRRVA